MRITRGWPILLALLVACTEVPVLPPISDSGTTLPGKMVWRDLITPAPSASRDFYHALLGWDFEALGDSGYSLIRHDGVLIGGMADANRIGTTVRSAIWLNAISVSDIDAAVRAAEKAGGRVVRGPGNLSRRGKVAVVMDAEGAVFQLVHSPTGDPVDGEPLMNQWLWTELISEDPAAASTFYENVAGYTTEAGPAKAVDSYRLLMSGGKARAGILENPFDDTRAAWIPYVRVADATEMATRAAELGARIVVAPSPDVRNGTVALILDPSGAPLALQQWSGDLKEVN
jgi:uncharacterized protein